MATPLQHAFAVEAVIRFQRIPITGLKAVLTSKDMQLFRRQVLLHSLADLQLMYLTQVCCLGPTRMPGPLLRAYDPPDRKQFDASWQEVSLAVNYNRNFSFTVGRAVQSRLDADYKEYIDSKGGRLVPLLGRPLLDNMSTMGGLLHQRKHWHRLLFNEYILRNYDDAWLAEVLTEDVICTTMRDVPQQHRDTRVYPLLCACDEAIKFAAIRLKAIPAALLDHLSEPLYRAQANLLPVPQLAAYVRNIKPSPRYTKFVWVHFTLRRLLDRRFGSHVTVYILIALNPYIQQAMDHPTRPPGL